MTALALYYRRGGTANFTWQAVNAASREIAEGAKPGLHRAGYPTIWASEAPTEFEPAGFESVAAFIPWQGATR